jgi:hypothetical protein
MDQLDDLHIASGSGQRRSCRGIRRVGFETVLVVVPVVVQSHRASVAQAPRLLNASPFVHGAVACGVVRASV